MKNLEYLLKEINILNKRIIDSRQNEEQFNVFDIMLNRFDEVKLHSRFISVLLDPNGTHKKSDAFLKLFIQALGLNFEYDLSSLKIYPNEKNRNEYKEIDILLIDRKKRAAVILENKINARDSNHENEGQIERYYRIITQGKEYIPEEYTEVIYLSINRDGPSEESVNTSKKFPKLKEKVINIHYDGIISWLEKCVQICYNQPKLRETIIQYIQLLRIMTNNITSEDNVAELVRIIGKDKDNLMSAKLVVDSLDGLHEFLIGEFWHLLSDRLEKRGYTVTQKIDNVYGFLYSRPRKFLKLKITSKTGCKFTVEAAPGWNLYIGASNDDARGNTKNAKKFCNEYKSTLGLEDDENWAFYKFIIFEGNSGMDLSDIHNNLTFRLISAPDRKEIVEIILSEMDALAEKYNKYIKCCC